MQPIDAQAFRELVADTLAMYGKEISVGTQRIWWAALAAYDFPSVRRAFSAHVTGKRGQFAPLPADILGHLRGESGHLSTEEAWALALQSLDESATVVWTDEIADAMASARPCLDAGDKFGASKAFGTAYERNIAKSHHVPVWRISLGDDKSHRIVALEAAHKAGRLTADQVRHFLPPKRAEGNVVALLAGKTDGLDPRWGELAKRLQDEKDERAEAQEADRRRQVAAFNAHRQALLDSLEGRKNG